MSAQRNNGPEPGASLEAVFRAELPALRQRLRRMIGDAETGEDLCQEAFLRAWSRAPRDAPAAVLVAWLRRTATNLALDELRRRARRPAAALGKLASEADDGGAAREALARLPVLDRAVLALRFQAGLSLRELGAVLGVSEEAARKRVARERDVLFAGGLVVAGSVTDVHPGLYGERPGLHLSGTPDARRDWRDLGALRTALRADLPLLGVCGGHQLLNLASGGTLHQHLPAGERHTGEEHAVRTQARTRARQLLGTRVHVRSDHHQGARRLGARLRAIATSHDSLVEGIERTDRRFAIGVQWRPQTDAEAPGSRRLAEALVAAAQAAVGSC